VVFCSDIPLYCARDPVAVVSPKTSTLAQRRN
jgi:hypothetical protein